MRITTALVGAALGVGLSAGPAGAQDGSTPSEAPQRLPGTVYTFYGLQRLEQDSSVSEADKLREWRSFIERAQAQIVYAERAVKRWKSAARGRFVEDARALDQDPDRTPQEKIARWQEVARLYPKTADARTAQRRAAHWSQQQTKRLVGVAERAEEAKGTKPARIKAWVAVLEWARRGPEARAAQRRIRALQAELYTAAKEIDGNPRASRRAKRAAWQEVLEGRPTSAQRTIAGRRISALAEASP